MKQRVICIHIGARAHYLLPKALEAKGILKLLITDTWISLSVIRSTLAKLPVRIIKSFSNRFSSNIPSSKVRAFSTQFLLTEIYLRIRKLTGWELILKRNDVFQEQALNIYRRTVDSNDALLSISYTSLKVFKEARQHSQKTILFQIDPGKKEEEIVENIVRCHGNVYKTFWQPAPAHYWTDWKQECALSDIIMVNSDWSKEGLLEQGVPAEKIRILPLPFELKSTHLNYKKEYPASFDKKRPMRCLFLGTLTLRKGIHIVLEVASKLNEQPIEFILVGQSELDAELLNMPNVFYKGVATRAETDDYYQSSDIFLFPTLSDGFGLTQLEAMAWQLPVIASKFCGEVVSNDVNGIILNDCNVDNLAEALIKCITTPEYLKSLSIQAIPTVKEFSITNFANQLAALVND